MQQCRRISCKVIVAIVAVGLLVVTLTLQAVDLQKMQLTEAIILEEATPITPDGTIAPRPPLCNLPNYDPFDTSILKYIKPWPRINCGKPQPPLTYAKDNRVLINRTAAEMERANLVCSLQEIIRAANDDSNFRLAAKKVFTDSAALGEFNVVSCVEKSKKKLVYESGHAYVKPVPGSLANRSKAAFTIGRASVFILGIDSMSRLNFIRQLPKAYQFITKRLRGVVLKGLTKVGDNTYPNMMALLAGLEANWGFASKAGKGIFDDLPAVWKNFSQSGYVTMYGEDDPLYSAFNYKVRHGFQKPPTDYYMRPFWLAMEKQNRLKSSDDRCYSHMPKHKFLFKYVEDFVEKMEKGKHAFFSFAFLSKLSHNHLNSVKVVDSELLDLLEKLNGFGLFNNTVVIIMGDHGNRFDEFRKTTIGRVEERMPFVSIILPPSLEHLRNNVEQNSEILTSWHDVYETLMDVAENNTNLESKQLRFGDKGLSLFRPIPNNRTCQQIGIPREYCVCWEEESVETDNAAAVRAGKMLVGFINKLLFERDSAKKCLKLELDKITSAQRLSMPQSAKRSDLENLRVLMRVTVQVKHSGALLEGTLEQEAFDEVRLVGDINRLNKYGNQSSCISDDKLALFCYCK